MAFGGGKVILFGEHAVVHGVPALAAGLDRGAWARAEPASESSVHVGSRSARAGDDSDLGRALAVVFEALRAPPMRIDVELALPAGCGLGASAALGVAIVRAVAPALALPDLVAAALHWERIFHGNPSGIDVWAAALGGCIRFVRGARPTPVRLGAPLRLAIGQAGPPSSTRAMVAQVARLRADRPDVVSRIFDDVARLGARAQPALEHGDLSSLGALLDENQELLCELGVSTPELEHACQLARTAGARGAKLTGAGGGGSVLALAADAADPILSAWREAGIPGFLATVGGAA